MRDVDILGSYWTLAGGAYPHSDHEYSVFDFKERVEAAARAGFKGIGLWHADLEHTLKTRPLKEMKRILDDNGIAHLELEFLTDWFETGDKKKKSDETRKMLMEAAEVLEARHIKIGDFFGQPCPMARLIDCFGELCREAEARGTKILYELIPISVVNTLDDTLAMVQGAGAKNGGFLFDTWHVFSLGISFKEIESKVTTETLMGVELNDGPKDMPTDPDGWTDATVNHRLLCGEGEFDLKGFIQCMDRIGYDGPYGIEVLNAEIREWPLDKIMTRTYETTLAEFN